MAQVVKNPPAMQETQEMQVQSLDQEEPLEEEMATHSNILAWKISWTEQPGGLQSMDHKESDMIERLFILILDKIPCCHYFAAQIVLDLANGHSSKLATS